MGWLEVLALGVKLLLTLLQQSGEAKAKGETNAAAIGRVLDEATWLVQKASLARLTAERNARASSGTDGLLADDGWRRGGEGNLGSSEPSPGTLPGVATGEVEPQ